MKLFLIAVMLASVGYVAPVRAEENKIGVVDMQKALQTVDAGKKAKSQLEGEFNKRKQELQKEEANLKKAHEEFQKQSLVMTEQARSKKQAELQERFMKHQELIAKSQQEIQKKEQELTEPIIVRLRKTISDVAKKKGYTVVLERNENNVLFWQEKDDLTVEVIGAFDKAKS